MERWTLLSSCRLVAQNCSLTSSLLKMFFFAFYLFTYLFLLGFLCGLDSKESAYNAGDPSSIPGSGGYPGEGNGNPLQYSCLENTVDRGAWQATVHGVAKSQIWLSNVMLSLFSVALPVCVIEISSQSLL